METVITSILKLVSHNKSANSTNEADLFDFILQRENKVNCIEMYYERVFTKLGYSAASISPCSHLSNQHIEIVRMFLDSELLMTELQVLAYFTHTITLPFLYFIEVYSNSNDGLLEMFPRLLNDLKVGRLDSLEEYRIEYPHVKVSQPESNFAKELLDKMCPDAVPVLK